MVHHSLKMAFLGVNRKFKLNKFPESILFLQRYQSVPYLFNEGSTISLPLYAAPLHVKLLEFRGLYCSFHCQELHWM